MQNESIIHADIFFFVSTIALVVISIGIVIALFYIIKVLRNAREISDVVKQEGKEIVSQFRGARFALVKEGIQWGFLVKTLRDFVIRKVSTDEHVSSTDEDKKRKIRRPKVSKN